MKRLLLTLTLLLGLAVGTSYATTTSNVPALTSTDADEDIEALYEEGKALYDAKKYTAALEKLRPAAEKGHKKAQYRVGRCYDKGNGVEENNKLAISWYKKSADQGYYKAEYQMARAYLKGKGGLTADEKKAKAYLKKAVGGKKHGQEMLDEIKKDANSGDEEAVRLLQLLNSN